EPGPRGACTGPVAVDRLDRGDEDLGGQVRHPLPLPDAPGDEALHAVEVLAIEGLEDVGIGADPAHLLRPDAERACAHEGQVSIERGRWTGSVQVRLHASYWSPRAKALPGACAAVTWHGVGREHRCPLGLASPRLAWL